jgi:hypothetical protein
MDNGAGFGTTKLARCPRLISPWGARTELLSWSPARGEGMRHKSLEALRRLPRRMGPRSWAAWARRRVAGVWCPVGCVVALVLMLTSYTAAAQVTLAWDASVSMVDGYWLYYGSASNIYTARIDVGTATTYTITGLASGQTYYFAVTAYDRTADVESPLSNEVGLTLQSIQPDFDSAQSGGTQLAGGGGGCTLNPGAGCDPLVLGITSLWFLWLTARVWTRVKGLDHGNRGRKYRYGIGVPMSAWISAWDSARL